MCMETAICFVVAHHCRNGRFSRLFQGAAQPIMIALVWQQSLWRPTLGYLLGLTRNATDDQAEADVRFVD